MPSSMAQGEVSWLEILQWQPVSLSQPSEHISVAPRRGWVGTVLLSPETWPGNKQEQLTGQELLGILSRDSGAWASSAPTSMTWSRSSMRPPRLQPGNIRTTLPLPPVAQKPDLQLNHSASSRHFFLCTNEARTTEVPLLQLQSPWGKRQSLLNLDRHIKFNFILIL